MNGRGITVGLAMITVCVVLNIAGVRVVGATSVWLFVLLSAPFAAIVVLAPFKYGSLANAVTTPTTLHVDIIGGLLVAMWNYMGWDNASTIAREVDEPQKAYPRAMMATVALVALTYILPRCRRFANQAKSLSVGDRFMGRCRGFCRRPPASNRPGARRDDERFRDV